MRPGKNIRLFKSDFFEFFSHVHPIVPIGVWGPLVCYWFGIGIYTSAISIWVSALSALAGLLIWTLAEYVLHRFIFHFKPNGPTQEHIAYFIHGIHHDDPADERRLLMPPVAGGVLAVIFYAFFTLVVGPILVKPVFSGFIIGYLIYDYTHFSVHYFQFQSKTFKRLKQNHMLHHFSTPGKRFGVSGTFWDSVFGTRG